MMMIVVALSSTLSKPIEISSTIDALLANNKIVQNLGEVGISQEFP